MADKPRKRKTSSVHTVLPGSTIRIEQPHSKRGKEEEPRFVIQEINPVGGFVGFLREHAIVGLSIGFILGGQMSAFVKIVVDKFLDPLTQLLFGTALSQRTFSLHFHGRVAIFGWGAVVYSMVIILLLLIFIYVIFKVFNLDKLDKKKEKA